jgi:D-methionine transport system permease protein
MWNEMLFATFETLYMVFVSSLISVVIGTPLGILLFITKKNGLLPKPSLFQILNIIVNIFRSIPFIILLALLIPVTRFIVGSSIGSTATIVPLSIGAIPFFARIVENVFFQLPGGLIEAGLSLGARPRQIIMHMLLPDALPALINGVTVTLVTLISYSAMAGAVGGGGLGALAIDYGYQRFDFSVLITTVIILVLMVQASQYAGDWLSKRLDH